MKKSRNATSSSRRKQRKAYYQASSGQIAKLMSVALSKDLRDQHGTRALPIRTGDTVVVLRGKDDFKKQEGKVKNVYRLRRKIFVEGIEHNKKNGQPVNIALNPADLKIIELADPEKYSRDKLFKRRAAKGVTPKTVTTSEQPSTSTTA